MKRRVIGILLCLAMCFSLLPQAAFSEEASEQELTAPAPAAQEIAAPAEKEPQELQIIVPEKQAYAPAETGPEAVVHVAEPTGDYQEGDIPGTTGTGTMDDPVICDTFEELKAALEDGSFQYVQMDAIVCYTMKTGNKARGEIIVNSEKKLIVNGYSSFRYSGEPDDVANSLINVGYNGKLSIMGTGGITFYRDAIYTAYQRSYYDWAGMLHVYGELYVYDELEFITYDRTPIVNEGTVKIYGGLFDYHISNSRYSGDIIHAQSGSFTEFFGGTFTGTNGGSYSVICSWAGTRITVLFHAGKFIRDSHFGRGIKELLNDGSGEYLLAADASVYTDGSYDVVKGPVPIGEVEARGSVVPAAGVLPVTDLSVPDNAHYSIKTVEWYNVTEGRAMLSGERLAAGRQYKLSVTYSAGTGTPFLTEQRVMETWLLTGTGSPRSDGSITHLDENKLTVEYTFAVPVSAVSIPGCGLPAYGKKPGEVFDFAAYADELEEQGVRIIDWSVICVQTGKAMGSNETFLGGRSYYVEVELETLNGADFSAGCAFDFKNVLSVNTQRSYLHDYQHAVVRSVPVEINNVPVSHVAIRGYDSIWAGWTPDENFSFNTYQDDLKKQGLILTGWQVYCDSDSDFISNTAQFVEGKQYSAKISLKAADGYKLTEGLTFELKWGGTVDTRYTTVNVSEGTATVWSVPETAKAPVIDHISIKGYKTPKAGFRPCDIFKINDYYLDLEEQHLELRSVRYFCDSTGDEIDDSDEFVPGRTYSVEVYVEAFHGFTIAPDCTFDFDGKVAVNTQKSFVTSDTATVWSMPYELPALRSISIPGFNTMLAGMTPKDTFDFELYRGELQRQGVTYCDYAVYCEDEHDYINEYDIFERGKEYSVELYFEAAGDTGFASDCKFDFYGMAETDYRNTTACNVDAYVWTVPQKAVGISSVIIPGCGVPVAGKTVEECFRVGDEGYYDYLISQFVDIGAILALCEDGTVLDTTDRFVAGKTYRAYLYLEAMGEGYFEPDCVFTFAGLGEAIVYDTYRDYEVEVLSAPMTVATPITSVSIPGYTDPVAGKMPEELYDFSSYSTEFAAQHVSLDALAVYCETTGRSVEPDEKFVAGNEYSVGVRLEPLDGYAFAENCVFDFGGKVKVNPNLMEADSYEAVVWTAPVEAAYKLDAKFSATCSFDERLAVNFYVPETYLAGYENVSLEVVFENWTGNVMTLRDPEYITGLSSSYNGAPARKFTFSGISAPEVGNRIYTVLCAEKNGVPYRSRTVNYAIGDYCYNMLKDGSGADAGLKKLCVNVLNYASAAQTYFNMNPGTLVNAKLTSAQKALAGGNVAVTAKASKSAIADSAKKLEKISAKVNMASAPELIFDLTLKSGVNAGSLRVFYSYYSLTGKKTISGYIPVTEARGGNVYRVKLDGFASADMRQPVTVKVLEGDTPVYDIITYSLECYCTSMLGTAITDANRAEMTKLQPLCQQMMNYSNAAKEYFVK